MSAFSELMDFLHKVDYAEHGPYKDGYARKSVKLACVVREIDDETFESRIMYERPRRVLGMNAGMKRDYYYKSNMDIAEWYAILNVLQLLNEKLP